MRSGGSIYILLTNTRTCICCYLLLFLPLFSSGQAAVKEDIALYHYSHFITRHDLRQHIELLASDSLEGRAFGTIGCFKAGEYIANNLRYENLKAAGDRETFFQPVVVNKWTRQKSDFDVVTAQGNLKYKMIPGADFSYQINEVPASFSISADHIMFAGYGISDDAYNDYQYAQIRGEVVLILEGEPFRDGHYAVSGSDKPSRWSEDLKWKVETAAQKGAKAVLLLIDSTRFPRRSPDDFAGMPMYTDDLKMKYSIPVIRINEKALAHFLLPRELKRVKKLAGNVKKGKVSSNYVLTNFNIRLSSASASVRDRNIVAIIEGSDETLRHEYIVLSAHYDHLGVRNGQVYNGADDNATGTAALISVSRALKGLRDNDYPFKRSVLFIFCTGEELGLLGSKYFVDHPVVPLRNVKADINIDMIGRRDDKHDENENFVYVIGSDKINPLLDRTIREANRRTVNYKLDYTYNDPDHPLRLYYRSDHYSFAERGIPSVFLFGGFHKDYHQPGDDAAFIDFKKVEDISRLIYFTVVDLVNYDGQIMTDYKN